MMRGVFARESAFAFMARIINPRLRVPNKSGEGEGSA